MKVEARRVVQANVTITLEGEQEVLWMLATAEARYWSAADPEDDFWMNLRDLLNDEGFNTNED